MQRHDVLQEQIVLSLCVCLRLISQVPLFHREGGVDVVGVVSPLVRGSAQVLHCDQVVELSVLLEVHERDEEEEDGEGQIEVESERGESRRDAHVHG